MMNRLRKLGLDDVIIATTAPQPRVVRLARWLKPKRITTFGACGADVELPLAINPIHEVEDIFCVRQLYGIEAQSSVCYKFTDGSQHEANRIAVHISAGKPLQRWPAERFVELMRRLHAQDDSRRFVLLWSPGASDNPLHPGDDAKASEIINELGRNFPIEPTTSALPALIAALARCSLMICADGGAMRIGAGLGLPIVALFGKSSTDRWRPWGVPQRLLKCLHAMLPISPSSK